MQVCYPVASRTTTPCWHLCAGERANVCGFRWPILHCLHVILNEEWEHQRYAVRDLRKQAGG